ncbi:MAG: GNAT family N-acetyltransferase, partial [Kiritimatiellaeota bacterium]|nr:GNAT family N-acetyltransferase [Kiritimatiellota bacterium]
VQERLRRNSRIFVAPCGGRFAAYMEIKDGGENFTSHARDMMNICGASALPEVRGTGLYADLLRHVEAVLAKEGYARLGVDYESCNPTALGFWRKHFAAYTNSLVRRIDERGGR